MGPNLLLDLHLLLVAFLAIVSLKLPPTRIHHLPDEQDRVGFDIADQEDERAIEFHKSPGAGLVS